MPICRHICFASEIYGCGGQECFAMGEEWFDLSYARLPGWDGFGVEVRCVDGTVMVRRRFLPLVGGTHFYSEINENAKGQFQLLPPRFLGGSFGVSPGTAPGKNLVAMISLGYAEGRTAQEKDSSLPFGFDNVSWIWAGEKNKGKAKKNESQDTPQFELTEEGEVFKPVRYVKYWRGIEEVENSVEVSNLGRIRYASGRYTKGAMTVQKYRSFHLNGSETGLVHIAVMHTFFGPQHEMGFDGFTVDHKNRVRDDNTFENLQYADSIEQKWNRSTVLEKHGVATCESLIVRKPLAAVPPCALPAALEARCDLFLAVADRGAVKMFLSGASVQDTRASFPASTVDRVGDCLSIFNFNELQEVFATSDWVLTPKLDWKAFDEETLCKLMPRKRVDGALSLLGVSMPNRDAAPDELERFHDALDAWGVTWSEKQEDNLRYRMFFNQVYMYYFERRYGPTDWSYWEAMQSDKSKNSAKRGIDCVE